MTERADDHPVTPDILADLQEGLLDADGEAAARRHLEACVDCRADLALLTDLPGRLAAAGDVGPLPEPVAARLDRALAAAAEEPADAPGVPTVPTASRTVTPLPTAHGPVRGMRLLQAAAAVVLVLGVGALGVSALTQGSDNGGSASTAGSAADSAGGKAAPEAASVAPITASGRDWTPGTVRSDAARLVDGSLGQAYALYDRAEAADGATDSTRSGTPAPSGSAPTPAGALRAAAGAAGELADPTTLRACVTNLTDGDTSVQPVAVDLARWKGQPAAVLVFPTTDDPGSLDVYVVAPDCPTGLFLHFARVPRS